MTLTAIDWAVIIGYFVVVLAIGMAFYRRAGTSVDHYFLSGRSLPWWLAGTSMVATTFAADTPLAVAGIVARDGIAGNWIWWNAALGSTLAVFFFARLWRRAGILTDVEFAELRYTGRPAAFLRGFRALYLGLPINFLIMGWVNLAMAKILLVTMGWDRLTAVLISLAFTGVYSSVSGLWGVVVGDLVQFILAMGGTIALAWFALRLPAVGGIAGLRESLPDSTFQFMPTIGGDTSTAETFALPVAAFIAFVGVQWWASWYPGQEASGGGYVAQRMMSAKDERHSLLATLWFTIAHYCIRPWPWILVGLASIVLYPSVADREAAYVMVLRDHLPVGWRGLLLGAFFAAYMSTIGTQLNWGCSYVINDFYRRFVRADADERHYIRAARLTTLLLMALGGVTTFYLESIRQAWEFILESGAGIGLVLILRWYWWRVNAWSEVTALVAPAIGFAYLNLFTEVAFPSTLFYLVTWTTICWLVVTFLTPPEPTDHLIAFYRRVRPGGPGWARIARAAGDPPPEAIGSLVVDWMAGWVLVYSTLFGIGALLFQSLSAALPYAACATAAALLLHHHLTKRGWKSVTG
ncbi:MAG: Na+:solute symporter [Vicinamibacterales bacterium]|jgi:Na+/proline symporter|nr:sodium:proline symporter [Acidobacteriota bacterium]MDP6373689.1 Na+:solute symporter [Vicinamibacterales bacterium]MDP6610097.1 Na+:solute symporter [Vicinamibacterales bacterium]HAK55461.1 sodium:proline symporter [Acidobacteriota bacterium]|tara:strand:- start:6272 stop:8011 length:1740 start_codon:yes stop_codon:yes gene_type:complete